MLNEEKSWGWTGDDKQANSTFTCPNPDFIAFNQISVMRIKKFVKLFPVICVFEVCMENTVAVIQEVGGARLMKR